MAAKNEKSFLRVGTLEELQARKVMVVQGADRPVAVFAHDGKVSAVDNRCPHMGFPLHRGSVKDGILTCHWHHARFDLCSGCAFDLFADDVPSFDVEVRDGVVSIAAHPRQTGVREHLLRRLQQGMEQNIPLIQAKSIIGLLKEDTDYREIVGRAAQFGANNRTSWASGMTILTAMANLVPCLNEEPAYLALYQGCTRVAADCAGQTPRRERQALENSDVPLETLKRWLRQWALVRHRDGAERTLRTAIRNRASPHELADLILSAATDRFFADGGHILDFCNKAFELLDLMGWEHAEEVLPSLIPGLVSSRGGEEDNAWRQPVDLVPHIRQAEEELPGLLKASAGRTWDSVPALAEEILGEDPVEILGSLQTAIRSGARPAQLSKALAYAAALRIARFGTTNEFGDWITALHTFTYCNALHQAIRRCPAPEVVRGVLHGAISVWLDRFLNVPPAPLPEANGPSTAGSSDGPALLQEFLEVLDQRQEIQRAARLVATYLRRGHPVTALFDTLTLSTVREDANFHTFQMVEAGIRQCQEWGTETPEGQLILIAVARYLSAHAPTQRAQHQTARIALRLHRGEVLYEDTGI